MLGRVRKAVFPAAGLGTRFLPATKAQPKEMLPLVDKPIIQYVIEEAVAAGLTKIIIVTGRGKNAIEDHFDTSYELEKMLEARGKTDLLEQVRAVSNMINVSYVRQGDTLGLGHAVLMARDLVGDEPFAVMLGDDIIDSPVPCMKQMVDVFERYGGPVIAIHQVPRSDISAFGVIDGTPEPGNGRVYKIRDLVEKRQLYGYRFERLRHDAANKLGFLKATVEFALKRPDLGGPFREYMKSLKL